MRELTVLHVITGLGTGGAEAMLLKLVRALQGGPVRSRVVSLGETGPVGRQILELGVPVTALGWSGARGTRRALARLAGLVRREQPALVQGWMYHGNVAATLATLWRGAPPVLWNIRMSLDDLSLEKRATRALVRGGALLSRLPARIIYNSARSADQHEAIGYAQRGRVVIPNGFDTDRFRPSEAARADVRRELGVPADALLIGQVGRFHPMKDHAGFLEAARLLAADWPAAHFVLVGAGLTRDNAELARLAAESGLGERLHLLGERTDVARLTAALDIATLASRSNEGFPNVVGEAMACGVPCVVTDVGDAARVVGEAGIVVPPLDRAALARAWARLLGGGERPRREAGERARSRIKQHFSTHAVAAEYALLYATLSRVVAAPVLGRSA